jgi:NADH-quinone oxidoreductase subunit G
MREIEGDAQINIIDRGYGSEIATFREEGVHSLISGNLMDVCPVGAITTRQYRFKSRPWDNPNAADTVCTLCSKGCSTTAWIKAKPEWAKGSRLVRITPRLNPDVNGYWMCDVGRFASDWIEGEERIVAPLVRADGGLQKPVRWNEAVSTLAERLGAAGSSNPNGVRFLLSAHASHEELFLFTRLAEDLIGQRSSIAVSWRVNPKVQPPRTKFRIPAVDAPNVNGARMLGLVAGAVGDEQGHPDLTLLREEVEAGRVAALFVFDPGPEGSIGDVSWIVEARQRGALPLLIVQGVLLTGLAREADVVLPGATAAEKEASYTNDLGLLQGTARAIPPPGDAMEDWHVLVNLSAALGVPFGYATAAQVRAGLVARHAGVQQLEGLTTLAFAKPLSAKNWLQASNPSERWKWNVMYQDLPPVKFEGEPFSTNFEGVIPLREVK